MLYKIKFIPESHATNSAAWPVPYACAQPYNLDSVSFCKGECFALASSVIGTFAYNFEIYRKQRIINVLPYCWRFLARCDFENSLHRY